MIKNIKEKYPEWINNDKKYYMCMTDDIDSLFSCLLLQQIKGYEISHFYSFDKMYRSEDYKSNLKLCGIDMDLCEGRCWGNHVTLKENPKSANLNTIKNIGIDNYYSKYCGSVLLQIISYYDIDISDLSEEAKMVLLSVDSTYLMYQFNQDNCKYWLVDILELPDLFQLCAEHPRDDFKALQEKYNIKKKIFVNENDELKTGLDLDGLTKLFNLSFILPENKFNCKYEYEDRGMNLYQYNNFTHGEIFTQAMTNKDYIKISY